MAPVNKFLYALKGIKLVPGADLHCIQQRQADFSGLDLHDANLTAADLMYVNFRVAYTLTRCGTRRAWFPRKGQYTTEWVGESPSVP